MLLCHINTNAPTLPPTRNTTRCSGDFVNGRLHGTGTMVDVVGQVWEGQWCEGAMHGEGRHSAPEMGEYEGDWVNGEFQGKGRISFKG